MKNRSFQTMWVIAASVPAAWIILGVINPSMLIGTAENAFAQTALPKAVLTVAQRCDKGTASALTSWPSVAGATAYSVFRKGPSENSWTNLSSKQQAAGYVDTNVASAGSYQYQIKTYFNRQRTYSNVATVAIVNCAPVAAPVASVPVPTPKIVPPPVVPVPAPAPQAAAAGTKMTAYITGYGWPDNTPPGAAISHGVIHSTASGTGTFTDPITVATGHSFASGSDVLDYPAGTKFYLPYLQRYFIVEDTCGDGNAPQNGPCHTGFQGNPWLDIWIGGQGGNSSSVFACEDAITALHAIIKDPGANYKVTAGPVFGTSCSQQFSETPITI